MGRIATSFGALVVIGCRTQAVSDRADGVTPTPTEVAPAHDRPAFLVQTKQATLVVPIDPGAAIVRVEGIWTAIGGDLYGRHTTTIERSADASIAALPICADVAEGTGCRMDAHPIAVTLAIEAKPGVAPTWTVTDARDRECTCVAVDGISTDDVAIDLDPELLAEAERLEMSPEEYAETCLQDEIPDLAPTAVLGGVLYMTGMGHSGTCTGFNIYDGADDAIALRPGATPVQHEMPEVRDCVESFAELSVDWLGVKEPECTLGDPQCNCRGDVEMEAWALRRGHLVRATGEIEPVGSGCSCAVQVPITAASCPSPSDPCGDPVGFTTIDTATDDFWITTLEHVALVVRKDRLLVVHRGDPKAIRDEAIPAPGLEIIGVEYQADAALVEPPSFPRTLRVGRPALALADREFRGDASAWGDRCVVHLRAKKWDDAEAACFAGLEAGGSNKTRGALTYNLGRVAEGRAETATALQWYRRSDRLRPGNETVKGRIDALAKPGK